MTDRERIDALLDEVRRLQKENAELRAELIRALTGQSEK